MTWTTIDVALPDDAMLVLVAMDDGEVWPAYLTADKWFYVTDDAIEVARVTHWMEIPAHPMSLEPA